MEPLFVARRSYRRRRLIDAIRLVPALGLVLFMAPVIGIPALPGQTVTTGIFIFGAWALLIGLTAWLGALLGRFPEGRETGEDSGPGGETGAAEPGSPPGGAR